LHANCVKKPRRSFGYACVFCLVSAQNNFACSAQLISQQSLNIYLKTKIPFFSEPVCIPPKQTPAGFARQFFQLDVTLVAIGFRCVLFGFVAVACGRQVGRFPASGYADRPFQ
jgi:hypothetical protein